MNKQLQKIRAAIQELQAVNSDIEDVNASLETALDCLVYCQNEILKADKVKPMATKRRTRRKKAVAPSLFDC